MIAKYLLLIINGIIVLGMLAALGAMVYHDIEAPQLAAIEDIEAATAGITGIVYSAERNLANASNLWKQVERMKAEPVYDKDPFMLPRLPKPEPDDEEMVKPEEPPTEPDADPEPIDEEYVAPALDDERDLYRVRDQTEWPDLQLTGTVVAGARSVAIINGEVYRVGSIVEGLQLREIGQDYVVVSSPIPGEERRVFLE